MTSRASQPHPAQARHPALPVVRFTLIELLVVIAIIGVLASMLLPAISKAKNRVLVTSCQNNQKQAYLALQMYGGDMEEYPTNYSPNMPTQGNWGDESCGRWNGGAASGGTTWGSGDPDTTVYHAATEFSAVELLLNGKYANQKTLACSVSMKGEALSGNGGWYFASRTWDNYQTGTYQYNGPHTALGNLGNNAAMTGLYLLSTHGATGNNTKRGEAWGHSFKADSVRRGNGKKFSVDQIPFLACPSIYRNDGLYRETHNPGSDRALPYAVQFDYNSQGWLARNYLFGDGHSAYVYSDIRTNYIYN